MKLIAHRGNINGRDPSTENTPHQIESCIEQGYDVEIDIRYDPETKKLYLGHDGEDNEVTWWWLAGKSSNLWIHCKDFATLTEFVNNTSGYNYFWHQGDDYTLTSKNYVWASDGKSYDSSTVVMVEDKIVKRNKNCYAVCSDYVGNLG